MTPTTDIHTCPYCELRFLFADEVRDHVITDHPEHASTVETAHIVELPRGD